MIDNFQRIPIAKEKDDAWHETHGLLAVQDVLCPEKEVNSKFVISQLFFKKKKKRRMFSALPKKIALEKKKENERF